MPGSRGLVSLGRPQARQHGVRVRRRGIGRGPVRLVPGPPRLLRGGAVRQFLAGQFPAALSQLDSPLPQFGDPPSRPPQDLVAVAHASTLAGKTEIGAGRLCAGCVVSRKVCEPTSRIGVMLVKYDQFVALVRERGEYETPAEARQVAASVLEILAGRISQGEAEDLAAQLPPPLDSAVRSGAGEHAGSYGVQEFCRRVAERTGGRPKTAEWDASAVLSSVAEAVSGGELNQLLSQLPSGYAPLFGKPGLS